LPESLGKIPSFSEGGDGACGEAEILASPGIKTIMRIFQIAGTLVGETQTRPDSMR